MTAATTFPQHPPTDSIHPHDHIRVGRSQGPRAASRILRGRGDDSVWVRPALLALLATTAFLYLWRLGDSSWANDYYSAAVQAAATSWKAFFFGSSDASNFITVDKSPAFLWPMALSARVFGVNSWSILVPQALEGVAAVGVLYLAVRRWFGPAAGLLAGAVLALTPVATLMFRFNNPDSLLVLLLTLGAYSTVRAVEHGSTRWIVAVGCFVGFGFLAKMLQALLVVPAFGLVYLVAAPVAVAARVRRLLLSAIAMVASAGWWVAIVELWPASSRPYIGGSQTNSVVELIFGYNGFGRLTGDEVGSVGGGPAGTTGRWGATGLGRLFNADYGGQISWLLPAALVLLVAIVAMSRRAPRADRTRASALLWGGWLLMTALAISLGQGIIHSYYTVALAPAIGALVGIGTVLLWRHRDTLAARLTLAGALGLTAWWSSELLGRTPSWNPSLRTVVLVGGLLAAGSVVLWSMQRTVVVRAIAVAGLMIGLAGPASYSWATVTTPHSGALPSAGPPGAGGFRAGGPGGRDGAIAPGRFGNRGGGPATRGFDGGPPAFGPRDGAPPDGDGPVQGPGGRGAGGILDAADPTRELTARLAQDADAFTWVAATVSANQAAGYQLATGDPVMAIGGFNGTDPTPTLGQFQAYVEDGRIHYFVAGGRGGGMGGGGSTASQITAWVQANFESTTVDGVTIYDLTTASTTAAA